MFFIKNFNFNKKPKIVFKKNEFLKSIFYYSMFLKARILYYINNWVYTTNHKRIAVNYFWFVILSGIVGMVLATVIRLELAYPGVGVFAGDSLQYLSLVSAHGVIMVFFMIMPLLFGAFANFLLPTQLGVHDVAFPRLNSAAFWFLPAGLLMLAQLVCIDRRYQRMNCFNIREVESLLKKRFFADLVTTNDKRELLPKTILNLRNKLDHSNQIETNFFLFYNYGTNHFSNYRFASFQDNNNFLNNNWFYKYIFLIKSNFLFNFFSNFIYYFVYYLNSFFFFLNNFKELFFLLFFLLKNSENFFLLILQFFNNFLNNVFSFVVLIKNYFFINFNILNYFKPIYTYIYNYLNYFKLNFLNIYKINTNFKLNFYFYNSNKEFNFSDLFSPSSITDYISNLFKTFITIFHYIFGVSLKIFKMLLFGMSSDAFYRTFFESLILSINFIYLKLSNFIFFFNKYIIFNEKKIISNSFQAFDGLKKSNLENDDLGLNKINNFYTSFYMSNNYNSYFVYFNVAWGLFIKIPSLIINMLLNIYSFKEMSFHVYNFVNYFIFWYIPLTLNDNIFFFFWQKASNVIFIFSKHVKIDDLLLFLFDINFFLKTIWMLLLVFVEYFSNFIDPKLLDELEFYSNGLINWLDNLADDILNFEFFNFFNNITFEKFSSCFINKLSNSSYNKNLLINKLSFFSDYFNNLNFNFKHKYQNEELVEESRAIRSQNPVFKYDYKSGDYFPKLYKEVYPFLFSSIIDLTGGLRQANWIISPNYIENLTSNFNIFLTNFENKNIKKDIHSWLPSRFNSNDIFYGFFLFLNNDKSYLNSRWISLNTLNQKFYKMFHTSSMQQRIFSNWRQLKFTREAWRCKLLISRHQKSLFRRYVNEDGVFWSIERNAKDLLPGWAMITPFSSRTRFTAIGKVDIGLMGVLLVLNSSIISGANFLVTYRYLSTLNNRKMRDTRAFFTEGVLVSSWMMIAANPMLIIGIIMLLSDRHWQTSFFDYSGGGDTVLFQHMFWFFGHPEVYIIIIPTFGFTNTILSYYLKKRVSARASLLYSMYTIAFLGFFVWGHHMYMVGLAHTTRMLFSTLTVMISVPAATKLMHWCVTLVNSSFAVELPMLCVLVFVFFFVSGGISGMAVAHTGMDVLFHDTFYVIGHFHVMLAGAGMFASFGAFYFYFVAIFGVKYSRIYAYLHFVYYLVGQFFTVVPMMWLGYSGMPRRVLDYPLSMGGWHSVISGGHMLSVAGLIAFFVMIFDSLRQSRAVVRNTFGISRYNTRLNFYIYEAARLDFIQKKAWTFFRIFNKQPLKLNGSNYINFEELETTVYSYNFINKL